MVTSLTYLAASGASQGTGVSVGVLLGAGVGGTSVGVNVAVGGIGVHVGEGVLVGTLATSIVGADVKACVGRGRVGAASPFASLGLSPGKTRSTNCTRTTTAENAVTT